MGDHRTVSPEILGVEVGCSVCRGVLVDASHHEIVGAAEVPLGPQAVDAAGVIDPGVVAPAVERLLGELPVRDRSRVKVGLTIGPGSAGVGSGPAMIDWLEEQVDRLGHPMVRSGGLGVVFVPIRAVDQAVKAGFEIGLDLARVDLAPVAAARAIGEQVDDVIAVGSGRGWRARMRDFEVLEAVEASQVGDDTPVCVIDGNGAVRGITRYGWIDLSLPLIRAGRVEVGRYAAASGVALGVLYESPGNLLHGEVVSGRRLRPEAETPSPPVRVAAPDPADQTLQLSAISVDAGADVEVRPAGEVEAEAETGPERHVEAGPEAVAGGHDVATVHAAPDPGSRATSEAQSLAGRLLRTGEHAPQRRGAGLRRRPALSSSRRHRDEDHSWDDDHVDEHDPINLFSPDTDEANMLGRNRRFGFVHFVVLLLVVAAVVAAYWYLYR